MIRASTIDSRYGCDAEHRHWRDLEYYVNNTICALDFSETAVVVVAVEAMAAVGERKRVSSDKKDPISTDNNSILFQYPQGSGSGAPHSVYRCTANNNNQHHSIIEQPCSRITNIIHLIKN